MREHLEEPEVDVRDNGHAY